MWRAREAPDGEVEARRAILPFVVTVGREVHHAVLSSRPREDVRRQALCQTVNAEGAEDVLARLEAAGVLRRVVTKHDGAGRPRRRWLVNPNFRNSR